MKTIQEIKNYINTAEEYKFLKKEDLLLAVLGGSLSYGTERYDLETGELLSDIDVRGICFCPKETLLGMQNFEQKIDSTTDTVIYSLNKYASLASNCNPNVIEMLDPVERNTLYKNEFGKILVDNRKVFFSRIAVKSFGGYASAQLDRLTNAIARDSMGQPELEEHIKNSLERMIDAYQYKYSEIGQKFKFYIDDASKYGLEKGLEKELYCDADFKHVTVRDYKAFIEDLTNIIKTYGKINHRNRKDDDHLCKHAQHLIRLLITGTQLLKEGDIHTYRPSELELFKDIRNGKYLNEDKTFKPEFFELVKDFDNDLKKADETSVLPKTPDYDKINKLIIELNEKHLDEVK